MSMRGAYRLLPLLGALLLSACASAPTRPLFYPNAHSEAISPAQREWDIDDCMTRARESGVPENKDGEVGKKAAGGALIGGIASGIWGLIRGDAAERALAGTLAGAATGGAVGAMDSTHMNPTFKRFVERCLRDKGYEVIGWK